MREIEEQFGDGLAYDAEKIGFVFFFKSFDGFDGFFFFFFNLNFLLYMLS